MSQYFEPGLYDPKEKVSLVNEEENSMTRDKHVFLFKVPRDKIISSIYNYLRVQWQAPSLWLLPKPKGRNSCTCEPSRMQFKLFRASIFHKILPNKTF